MNERKYKVLTTTTQQLVIERASETLENAGIPLVVDHNTSTNGENPSTEFRVLVPSNNFESARRLIVRGTSAS